MTEIAARPAARWPRQVARVLLTLYFRRVEVTGLETLPAGRGGLLLAWHPNGLIDPALILATFPGRVVFGARHGLFRWPLLGALLRATAVPIFRRQDLPAGGDEAAARRGNDASLAALAGAIAAGSFAVLFPEGDSHDEPRPLELRTGAARLWLDAAARAPAAERPHLVPVGLHYDRKRLFRSRALVEYHPPLDLGTEPPVEPADEAERREAARRLTGRFAEVLDRTVLATADWQEHHLMHRLRRLMRAERAARAGEAAGPVDMRERRLGFARVWTAFRERRASAPAEVARVRELLTAYDRRLRRLGLEDHELDRDPDLPHGRMLAALAVQRVAIDTLLPPLVAIGVLANLPTALAIELAVRAAARRRKDVATIKLLLGAVLFPATWLLLGLFAGWGQGFVHDLYPEIPHLPWLTGAVAFLLSALGGALVVVWGRVSRRFGRGLVVLGKRRIARAAIRRRLAERAAIFDAASALAAGLDLPGRVGPGGRIVEREPAPTGPGSPPLP